MVSLNLFPIFLAAVANFVVGMVWYSPIAFGNIWIRLSSVDTKKPKYNMVIALAGAFMCALLTATVIDLLQQWAGVVDLADGLKLGVLVWFGFIACMRVNHSMFDGSSMQLVTLNAAYDLVSILVMSTVLATWG